MNIKYKFFIYNYINTLNSGNLLHQICYIYIYIMHFFFTSCAETFTYQYMHIKKSMCMMCYLIFGWNYNIYNIIDYLSFLEKKKLNFTGAGFGLKTSIHYGRKSPLGFYSFTATLTLSKESSFYNNNMGRAHEKSCTTNG